jgi:type II secretory pathway component GspD/PulD (secretin)
MAAAVNVPGISDTLKAIIGDLNIDGGGDSAAARSGETDAAFEPRVAQLARPRISIDRRTNSVIVRGSPGDVATIAQVIRELDQPLKMIEIEVIVATASLGVVEELGVALRGLATQRGRANGSAAGDTGCSGRQVGNDAANLFDSNGLNALSLLPAVGASSTIAAFVVRGASSILQVQLKALADNLSSTPIGQSAV